MKRLMLILAASLLTLTASGAERRLTGLIPTPPERKAAIAPMKKFPKVMAKEVPGDFVTICTAYNIDGNDRYGICVTAEESNHFRAWSTAMGYQMVVIPTANVISWARKHGYLNGAMLPDVMDSLKTDGLVDAKGVSYRLKDYFKVDYTSQDDVKEAIYRYKTLNIAIDAGCIDNHTSTNGWMELQPTRGRSLNHCVGLHGYGSLSWLCSKFNVSVPSGSDGNQFCVVLYTWGSVGIVSWPALQAMMPDSEAYGREPGAVPSVPFPPGPTPQPAAWPALSGNLLDDALQPIRGELLLTLTGKEGAGSFRYLIQRVSDGRGGWVYSPTPKVIGTDQVPIPVPVDSQAEPVEEEQEKDAQEDCPGGS